MKTNLKQIRKNAGWSNADDFAQYVEIPAKTYRNYEQGVRKIGLDVACKLCNALGCTLEDLVGMENRTTTTKIADDEALEPDEKMLVAYFRDMDDKSREMLLTMARSFALTNDPNAVWRDENGNVRTTAEIRGLR